MEIKLKRLNNAVHFKASNKDGNSIEFDGSPEIGGEGKGMRPMEVLLSSVAGCSVFDIVSILKKQRENLMDISITATGDRKSQGDVKPFTSIHLRFDFKGDLTESKVARAVELSVEKYCSVASSLDPNINITHSYTINSES